MSWSMLCLVQWCCVQCHVWYHMQYHVRCHIRRPVGCHVQCNLWCHVKFYVWCHVWCPVEFYIRYNVCCQIRCLVWCHDCFLRISVKIVFMARRYLWAFLFSLLSLSSLEMDTMRGIHKPQLCWLWPQNGWDITDTAQYTQGNGLIGSSGPIGIHYGGLVVLPLI